jgi:8-oxo-dGTP pyrophosphatase MutT (NUDIX family)
VEVVERQAVRAVIVDADERVLLFRTQDPTQPELGVWWELPGGGLDPGESYLEAIVREVAEETGLVITAEQVGPPVWRRSATYLYRGQRRISHEVIVAVRLDERAPGIDGAGRVGFEDEDYFDFGWLPVAEVISSPERFYPGRLPEFLGPLLAGVPIDEPMETWS